VVYVAWFLIVLIGFLTFLGIDVPPGWDVVSRADERSRIVHEAGSWERSWGGLDVRKQACSLP
jgi:hypothetical protein